MNKIDFDPTASDYGTYRAGFPSDFFARVGPYGLGLPGQRLLDLGTGTGTLARGFALRGCRVTGLDPAGRMLEKARELDRQAGVEVNYIEGHAENTGLPDASFDVVTAGQCWHWFDRRRAGAEAFRLLRDGAAAMIARFDWLPLPGSVVETTIALIRAYNPQWQSPSGYHWPWFPDLSNAGFIALESFSFDVDQLYTHESWRGRIRASAPVGAALTPEAVERFDSEHAALLLERFSSDTLHAPHRVFALIGRKPSA